MKNKNLISYLTIVLGGSIAIYANAAKEQNVLLLVLGIILLMFGVYIVNSKLTSKPPKKEYDLIDEEE
jgi:uncharacterized membrane protein